MVAIGIGVGVVFGGAVPAPFTPLDLSPALWLDASDTSTITASSGAVSEWRDKSGNGNNFTQGTAALQPTTGTRTINGLNVLDFASDLLANSPVTISGAQPITIFVVAEPDTDHYGRLLRAGGGPPEMAVAYLTTGRMVAGAATTLISATGQYSGGTAYLSRFALNGASSSIHMDGVSIASGDASTSGLDSRTSVHIGATSSGNQHFDGKLAEMIVVAGGLLTAQQITDTETYLAAKWGITL